jgi:predicted nuclease with RNAse H fold
MGTLVAIPRAVDLELLDLSSRGYAIARALQEYGAYVVDASENFTLYAEPSAEELLRSARRDLDRIRREVRVVVDQQNARAAPTAPPFAT